MADGRGMSYAKQPRRPVGTLPVIHPRVESNPCLAFPGLFLGAGAFVAAYCIVSLAIEVLSR